MLTTKYTILILKGTHILFLSHFKHIMPFFNFQQSSWKDDYLLSQQSDDEGSDVFEKSGASLPERRSSKSRVLLIATTLAACYSIFITAVLAFITAVLARNTVRSIYTGPNIIYSKLPKHFGTVLGLPPSAPTAYHDLHCIRFLHKTVYPEYYFPNDSEKKQLGRDAHARTLRPRRETSFV